MKGGRGLSLGNAFGSKGVIMNEAVAAMKGRGRGVGSCLKYDSDYSNFTVNCTNTCIITRKCTEVPD